MQMDTLQNIVSTTTWLASQFKIYFAHFPNTLVNANILCYFIPCIPYRNNACQAFHVLLLIKNLNKFTTDMAYKMVDETA